MVSEDSGDSDCEQAEDFSFSESDFDSFFVRIDKSGDAVDEKIAPKVNAGTLLSPDKDMLTEVLTRHPRRKNVTNVRHPKVNEDRSAASQAGLIFAPAFLCSTVSFSVCEYVYDFYVGVPRWTGQCFG